jgi:hypothetical protein
MGDTVDAGDYVTVTDALSVHLSGKKATDKVYVSHTGFMGGLKEVPIGRMRERRPEEVSSRGCDVALDLAETCLGQVVVWWMGMEAIDGLQWLEHCSARRQSRTKAR